jgi:pimeloyl-ACP methyl ester carboxylesterase
VIVNAVGRDARCAYRPLQNLAESLAAEGFSTLRYDHVGEGDSLGAPAGEDPVEAWCEGVAQAVRALKSATGLDRLVVIGLRLGGALALLGAPGADGLVLLAPVVSGAQWVRELKLAGRMSATYREENGGLEAEGLQLPAKAVKALQKIDLTTQARTRGDVLMALPHGSGDDLTAALREGGARVTSIAFPDYAPLFVDAHSNAAPEQTFSEVRRWLGERYPMSTTPPQPQAPEVVSLKSPGAVEAAVSFGAGLRGVLCTPDGEDAGRKAVVFCNTGGDPRAGIGGFAANAARSLAPRGVSSLRFDFAGFGDSAPADQNHVFDTSRLNDFAAALDLLTERGFKDLTLVGICSGAYHALLAAEADARVTRLLLVNPIKLTWTETDTVEAVTDQLGKSTRSYVKASTGVDAWKRLLTGKIDVKAVVRTLMSRHLAQPTGSARRQQTRVLRHRMQVLADRGVKVQILGGHMDGCLDEVERYFGRDGRMLTAMGIGITIEEDLDHGLALSNSRRIAQDVLSVLVLS